MTVLGHPFSMLILGLVAHAIKRITKAQRAKRTIELNSYILQTVAALVGAIAGMVALQELGLLTAINAFGVGYMANSMADLLEKKETF